MAFLVGLIIGFLMCIPIGPINIWVINTQLKKNAFMALAIAFGGSLMDFIYFYFIVSGISLFEFSDNLIFYLKIAGILLIFLLGLKELLSSPATIPELDYKYTKKGVAASILIGVTIYVSNPTLVITMTGLGAFVKSLELFTFSRANIFMLAFALALGSFLWFCLLVKIVGRFQTTLRNKYLTNLTKISGILMIVLALLMGYRFYQKV